MSRKLRILISGMVAGDAGQGGASWAVLQYVLGLMDLGHNVILVEPIPEKKLLGASPSLTHSTQAGYLHTVASHFDLHDRLAMIVEETKETIGIPFEQLKQFSSQCDVLINISGMLKIDELVCDIPVRVFLDLDPAFNQVWHSEHGIDMGFSEHTHHLTVGLAMGSRECTIPTCNLEWKTTMPPVVLRLWPTATSIQHCALTSVANLRGYGSVEYAGQHYGQKVHSLRDLHALPMLTKENIALAMQVDPMEKKDLEALITNRWKLLDPTVCCATPWDYQRFIQGSKGEFGPAKSGYVISRSGWFSDRSACYLASGRPVIAQATGFENYLPVGQGLFAFRGCDDALAAIDSLNTDYDRHARGARALAEEYFDSRKVLVTLLNKLGF